MRRAAIIALALYGISSPAGAEVQPYPAAFRVLQVAANGVTIHVRVGGKGPSVVLLHGYGEVAAVREFLDGSH